jgi:hypothetical protein
MSTQPRRSRWSAAGVWPLAWIAAFLIQFTMSRTDADPSFPLRLVTAALQGAIIAIPIVALFRTWPRVPVPRWQRRLLFWFVSYLLSLAFALGHVQALRSIFSEYPYWIYSLAHWLNVLLGTIAIPTGVVLVLCVWIAARRKANWHILDAAVVAYGGAVLSLLCLMNSTAHAFDRVDAGLGDAWLRLICVFLPIALVLMACVLWIRSRLHGGVRAGADYS